jgi:tannase
MVCSSSILHSSLIPHSFVTLQTDYPHSLGISSKVKMRGSTSWAFTAVASVAVVHAVTLNDVCTSSYVQASLPSDGFYQGITIDPSSVLVNPVTNTSVSNSNMFPDGVFDYCNVTFAYTHNGRGDQVLVTYWLPTPDTFQNRYLSTGGGGLAINSGTTSSGSLPGGIIYGAVAGATDGGFGSFDTQFDAVFLLANGTINWESVFMFGYEAHHEMSAIGKEFTKQFFNMSDTKLYSYYQACSEGGREGWSQVQRYADEWDEAITGAPAFRFSFQQVQHLYSSVVEQTMGYYPPPCELQKIVNETIAVCDPLDGKTDGVVARTDLCKLHFNVNTTIGKPYYCAATSATASPFKAKRQMGLLPPCQPRTGL